MYGSARQVLTSSTYHGDIRPKKLAPGPAELRYGRLVHHLNDSALIDVEHCVKSSLNDGKGKAVLQPELNLVMLLITQISNDAREGDVPPRVEDFRQAKLNWKFLPSLMSSHQFSFLSHHALLSRLQIPSNVLVMVLNR